MNYKDNPTFEKLRGTPIAGEGKGCFFAANDNEKLFYQYWLPEDEKKISKILICFHGAAGHGQFFALVADFLVQHGFGVFVHDYRGHGLSNGLKGDIPDYKLLLEDSKVFVESIRTQYSSIPIFLLGESLGGILAINYAAEYSDALAGVILLSPALKFRNRLLFPEILFLPIFLLTALFFPSLPVIKVTGHEHLGIKNPIHIEYDKTDPFHLQKITPRYFLEILKLMTRGLNYCPYKINIPVILFQGEMDGALDVTAVQEFIKKLASRKKELVLFPKGYHALLTDPDAGEIKDMIVKWLAK